MKPQKNPTLKRPYYIFFLLFLFLSLVTVNLLSKETIVDDWHMNIVGLNDVKSGEAVTIQLFLIDNDASPITNADINLILDMPEMVHSIEKTLHHVEDGLYETEVVLSMGGTWIGMVEAKQDNKHYNNQFLIQASGPIVSKQYRDPTDHINLDQPLPAWVQAQYEE